MAINNLHIWLVCGELRQVFDRIGVFNRVVLDLKRSYRLASYGGERDFLVICLNSNTNMVANEKLKEMILLVSVITREFY